MVREGLSEAVRALLAAVGGHDELEVLVYVRQQGASGATLEAIANALGFTPMAAQDALRSLVRAGLLSSIEGTDAFRCEGDEARLATVDALVHDYDERLIDVMRVLNAQALQRVRTEAMHRFADAFIVGRKKDG